MDDRAGDVIYLRDVRITCIVGTHPEERITPREVVFNLALHADLRAAGQSDRLEDTVNYQSIEEGMVDLVRQSKFLLLERLAEAVAGFCLQNRAVRRVDVTVDKPGALPHARSVAVSISRRQD